MMYRSNTYSGQSAFSELYHSNGGTGGYDALNRLTAFSRGTLSDTNSDGVPDTVSTSSRSQGWTLDALGNATTLTTGSTGQSRSFNTENQMTTAGTGSGSTYTYDGNGNQKTGGGKAFVYDAWNRLVSVSGTGVSTPTGNNVIYYSYDALGRRVVEYTPAAVVTSDAFAQSSSASSETVATSLPYTDLYYSKDWQVVEQDTRDDGGTPGLVTAGATVTQYVWGGAYVNDLVSRDVITAASTAESGKSIGWSAAGHVDRVFAQQDANWDVTSVVGEGQANNADLSDPTKKFIVIQRLEYDPYGTRSTLTSAWAASSGDSQTLRVGFQGGFADLGTLYVNYQRRDLDVANDRWLTQDPSKKNGGYPDGYNRYLFVGGRPVGNLDPTGEIAIAVPVVVGGAILVGTAAYLAAQGNPALQRAIDDAARATVKAAGKAIVDGSQEMARAQSGMVTAVVDAYALLPWIRIGAKLALDDLMDMAHSSGKRPSTLEDHQKGLARLARDRGGEKGDDQRRPPSEVPQRR